MKRGEVWTVSGAGYAGEPRRAVIVQDDRNRATFSAARAESEMSKGVRMAAAQAAPAKNIKDVRIYPRPEMTRLYGVRSGLRQG